MKSYSIGILILSLTGTYISSSFLLDNVYTEVSLLGKLSFIDTKEYERHIEESLSNYDLDTTKSLLFLAKYSNRDIDYNLYRQKVDELSTTGMQMYGIAYSFGKGAITGESYNSSSMVGSVASDLTSIGDVRTLIDEADKYNSTGQYDKLDVGLAVTGIALTVGTVYSGGSTIYTKSVISPIKTAYKAKVLTKGLTDELTTLLSNSFDVKALYKDVKSKDIGSVVSNIKSYSNPRAIKEFEQVAEDIYHLKSNSAITTKMLSVVDNTGDIKRLKTLSNRYKSFTPAIVKLLGRGAITSYKALNLTYTVISYIVGLVVSIIMNLFLIYRMFRSS